MIRLFRSIFRALFVVTLACHAVMAQAPEDLRFALVIGNSDYLHVGALRNPLHDANAMSESLARLGFRVTKVLDASDANMRSAVLHFGETIRSKKALALFYYAGHGAQVNWRNYLIPVNAKITSVQDIESQSTDVGFVLAELSKAQTRANVLILDACRDNPFPVQLSAKGLAPLDAPVGTYFAYATAPGNVAMDGDESMRNGLFTHFLLKEIERPVFVEDMFRRVRVNVRMQSKGKQIPWDSSSLEESIAIATRQQPQTFENEKMAWDKVKSSQDAQDVASFLEQYPSGHITQQALFKLEKLAPAKIEAQQPPHVPSQTAGQSRFRVGDVWTEIGKDASSQTVKSRITYRVVKIVEDIVTVHSEWGEDTRSLDGGILKMRNLDGVFEFDPPRVIMPGDAIVSGKKWVSTTVQKSRFASGPRTENFQVMNAENISIAAGRFDAFRISSVGYIAGTRSEFNYWVLPDFGVPLKWTRTVYRGTGKVQEVYELESFHRP